MSLSKMRCVSAKQRFLKRLVRGLFESNTPIIQSPMGTGKSKAIRARIKKTGAKSVMII